jgi:hypothetical protein
MLHGWRIVVASRGISPEELHDAPAGRASRGHGLSVAANCTLSHYVADTAVSGGFSQFTGGYTKPDDPSFDEGQLLAELRAHLQCIDWSARVRASPTRGCA